MNEVERWLGSVRALDNKIKSLQEQIERCRSEAERATSNVTGCGGGKGRVSDRTGELASKLADEEQNLNELMQAQVARRMEIRTAIERVECPTLQTLLYSRYILFKPWWKVANDIGYSCVHTRKHILKEALKKIEISFKKR